MIFVQLHCPLLPVRLHQNIPSSTSMDIKLSAFTLSKSLNKHVTQKMGHSFQQRFPFVSRVSFIPFGTMAVSSVGFL